MGIRSAAAGWMSPKEEYITLARSLSKSSVPINSEQSEKQVGLAAVSGFAGETNHTGFEFFVKSAATGGLGRRFLSKKVLRMIEKNGFDLRYGPNRIRPNMAWGVSGCGKR